MNTDESLGITKWLKAFSYLACLAVLVLFSGYHVYRILTSDVQYVPAKERTTVDSITLVGYIAREESTVIGGGDGIIRAEHRNASKYTVGEKCVSVYPSSCAPLISRIEELEKKLELYDRIMKYSSLSSAENNIFLSYTELMKKYAEENCRSDSEISDFIEAMMMREYIFDKESLKKARENALAELEAANGMLNASSGIKAGYMPFTGYVFCNGDGFGQFFSAELAVSGSAEDIFNAIGIYNGSTEGGEASAVAAPSNVWYILAPVSDREATLIEKGREYRISFGGAELFAVADDIRRSKNGGETVAVLRLENLPPSCDYARRGALTLYLEEERSYNLPASAVRISENGDVGVYVMYGGVVLFRRVEVIKSTDTYVLVKSHSAYVEGLNEEKPAEDIFQKESGGDSSDVGIFRGNAYTSFEGSVEDAYSVLVKDPFADIKINTRTENEPSEFEYLGENELIIISGKNLYHGKLLN